MKNKKIVYLVVAISAVILAVVVFYAYRPADKQVREKTPQVKQANKTKEVKPAAKQPKKPPEVKTYKQEVITVADAGAGKDRKEEEVWIEPSGGEGELASGPTNIALDKDENIYISDSDRIKKYDTNGKFIKNIPSPIYPEQVVVDNEDNLYVLSRREYDIYKINQKGNILIKYPLSAEISLRGESSLDDIQFLNNFLYGSVYLSQNQIEGLSEGSYIFKIGSATHPFSTNKQRHSLVKGGYLTEDGRFYAFEGNGVFTIKDKNKLILKFQDKFPRGPGGWSQIIHVSNNRIYIAGVPSEKTGFMIQSYSKNGHFYSQAKPFGDKDLIKMGFDWRTQFIAAITDNGNIYLFNGDSRRKKDAFKILKLTLEEEKE